MRKVLWLGDHPINLLPLGFDARPKWPSNAADVIVVDLATHKDDVAGLLAGRTPVVVLGTYLQVRDAPAGVTYAIQKPVSAEILAVALRRLFRPESYRSVVEERMEEWSLTPQERVAVLMAVRGIADSEMGAATAGIGPTQKTWKNHLANVYKKTGYSGFRELVAAIFPV